MKIIRLLPKQMFCGRLVVQKIANKSLKGDSGMTGNKRNTNRRQQELPVHNRTNIEKLVNFMELIDKSGESIVAFCSALEMSVKDEKSTLQKL